MDVEKFVKQIWGGHKDAVAAICIVVEAALKEDRKEREEYLEGHHRGVMDLMKAAADVAEEAYQKGLAERDPLSVRLERCIVGHPIEIFADGEGFKIMDVITGKIRGKGKDISAAVDMALEEAEK